MIRGSPGPIPVPVHLFLGKGAAAMGLSQLNKLLLAALLLATAHPATAFFLAPSAFATAGALQIPLCRSCPLPLARGVGWARRGAGVAVSMSLNVEPGAVGDEAGDLRAMAAMALRIQILEDALGTMDRQLDAANTRVAELEVHTPRALIVTAVGLADYPGSSKF